MLPLPLSFLLLHLNLDDALELVALILCLLPEATLLLSLLLPPRHFEITIHGLQLVGFGLLFRASCPLRGLHGALRAQSVHLGCLVLGLLLLCTEPGSLGFLLGGDGSLLLFELAFAPLPVLLILDDLLLLQLPSEHLIFFDLHRCGIGLVHLHHEALRRHLLLPLLLHLLGLESLDLLQNEGTLLVTLLLLAHPLSLPVLDLLDDDLSAAALALKALLLAHLVHAQGLETLDLHHGIEVALLLFLLRLGVPLLLDLRITNSHNLSVEHHLVHVLDIVHILVQHLLRPLKDAVLLRPRLLVPVADQESVLLPLLFQHLDLLLPVPGDLHALLAGRLLVPLQLELLLPREKLCIVAEAVQFRSSDDNGFLLCGSATARAVKLPANLDGVLANDYDIPPVIPLVLSLLPEEVLVETAGPGVVWHGAAAHHAVAGG
mmetsp:Transcript_128538/g.274120  ORF Transcript_128538/g.274120 Transcript_128538/m.274120 type:complete len:433 (+) Transcript_128538:43-1341(+)